VVAAVEAVVAAVEAVVAAVEAVIAVVEGAVGEAGAAEVFAGPRRRYVFSHAHAHGNPPTPLPTVTRPRPRPRQPASITRAVIVTSTQTAVIHALSSHPNMTFRSSKRNLSGVLREGITGEAKVAEKGM